MLILTTAIVSAFHLDLKRTILNIVFHIAQNPVYEWFYWTLNFHVFSKFTYAGASHSSAYKQGTSRVKIFIVNENEQ